MITSDIVVPALSLFEKKLSFQSKGSGFVLANTIGKFLSIFVTAATLIFIILVTVIYNVNKYYRIKIFTGCKSLYGKLISGVYKFSPRCKY